jgi:outer membrane protein TolC
MSTSVRGRRVQPIRLSGAALLWSLASAVSAASAGSATLTLDEAIALALEQQPALTAEEAGIRALRHEAAAAGALPDPQLMAGLMQMPVNEDKAFSLREDDFTALSVGIAQEFPRAEKRRLRAARLEQQAAAGEAGLGAASRRIQRDAAWAYLDVFAAGAGAKLIDRLATEAKRQLDASRIGLVAGGTRQAEVAAMAVDVEVLNDRAHWLRQKEATARSLLARWIGAAADRPLPDTLPALPAPAPLADLLGRAASHPLLAQPDATARVAATERALAEAATKPDWRLELRYDHRLEFPDLVTVMVGVDLPLFASSRQDRRSAAARESLQVARTRRDDALRELTAALTASYRNWQAGEARLRRYDDRLLPESRRRVAAALADYQSGQGPLAAVLEARRSLLESELMRLELAAQVARDRLALRYFETETVP